MPRFSYTAIDSRGQTATGALHADSRSAAMEQVIAQGLTPVKLDAGEGEGTSQSPAGPGRVSASHVEAFTRELSHLLSAGVSLSRALSVLKREASHAGARALWSAVHDDVVGGASLADALGRWPRSFPPVYSAMVRAGEAGGFLDVVLNQIAEFRAKEGELKGKVKAAMIYPAVLAVLAVGVLIFLLTFFIPRFSGIFEEFGSSLPWLTQMIIAASHVMVRYGPAVVVGLVVLFIVIRRAAEGPSGRRAVERVMLGTPGFGSVLARFALVRFSRMLGTLLEAGVPLETALRMAREALGNQTLADAIGQAIEQVKRGAPLSRALGAASKLFPPSVIEMVAVAEETGRLDKELQRLAKNYEVELDRELRMLVALVEPLMLIVMVSIVGTIIVGMLLPIFTLQELIH